MNIDRQVWFGSASEALEAGYKPCKLCNPELSHDMNKTEKTSWVLSHWKMITVMLVLIGIGSYFFYSGVVDLAEEYELVYRGETTLGYITYAEEELEYGDAGNRIWYHHVEYMYQLPNGKEFTGTLWGHGRLKSELRFLTQPYPVNVTYLPDRPSISRIAGNLSDSIFELIRSHVVPYWLFSIIFWLVGFVILRKLIREK